jgi:hypothetical protein
MTPFEIALHVYNIILLVLIFWLPTAYFSKRKFKTAMVVQFLLELVSVVALVNLISVTSFGNVVLVVCVSWVSLNVVIVEGIWLYRKRYVASVKNLS